METVKGLSLFMFLLLFLFFCWGMDLIQKYGGRPRFTKPLLVPLIMCIYIMLCIRNGRQVHMTACAAMAAGWLGDVFLMFRNEKCFLTGLFSFLAGHIMYAAVFLTVSVPKADWRTAACVFLYAIYAMTIFRRLAGSVKAGLRIPVLLYVIIILFMSLSAGLLHGHVSFECWLLLWGGSLLFVISDTLVAVEKFLNPHVHGVMETYVPAQLLLMLGIFLL